MRRRRDRNTIASARRLDTSQKLASAALLAGIAWRASSPVISDATWLMPRNRIACSIDLALRRPPKMDELASFSSAPDIPTALATIRPIAAEVGAAEAGGRRR